MSFCMLLGLRTFEFLLPRYHLSLIVSWYMLGKVTTIHCTNMALDDEGFLVYSSLNIRENDDLGQKVDFHFAKQMICMIVDVLDSIDILVVVVFELTQLPNIVELVDMKSKMT
eukprot:Gb_37783 [translate_table: standard]